MFRLLLVLFWVFGSSSHSHAPVGFKLTYAVDEDNSTKQVDMKALAKAVKRRVHRYAKVNVTGSELQVGVFGSDRTNVERVAKLIADNGVLEFRIMADRSFDGKLIEFASGENFAGQHFVHAKEGDEKPIAQWCALAESANYIAKNEDLASREAAGGGLEALVLIDSHHVSGADCVSVTPSTDKFGRSSVAFALSADGAKRMRRLTSQNLPSADDPPRRRLMAMILNGKILLAPSINSAIEDRVEITGTFSEQEIDELCGILTVGRLPVRLKLVATKSVTSAKPTGELQ